MDVARARIDPARSVVARVPVGCNPVRLVTSPDGGTAWITTRGDHAVVAGDTNKLLTDSEHAIVARIRVGTSPVGVIVVDGGRRVIATNSNRFAGDANNRQSLNVVDVSHGAANATLLIRKTRSLSNRVAFHQNWEARMRIVAAVLVVLITIASTPLIAQSPGSLGDWSRLSMISAGEKLLVRLEGGKKVKGEFLSVTDSMMQLLITDADEVAVQHRPELQLHDCRQLQLLLDCLDKPVAGMNTRSPAAAFLRSS